MSHKTDERERRGRRTVKSESTWAGHAQTVAASEEDCERRDVACCPTDKED